MKNEILIFVKDVACSEWGAFSRDFKKGETVLRFHGHTYGLDRDDMEYGGRETIPCSFPEDSRVFFTVPVEFLVAEDGSQPRGDYRRLD